MRFEWSGNCLYFCSGLPYTEKCLSHNLIKLSTLKSFHRIFESQNHRKCWVGREPSVSLSPGPVPNNPTIHLRALSIGSLNSDSLDAVTTALESLFQYWATLWVKNVFLRSHLNLPWLWFMPFSQGLSLVTRVKWFLHSRDSKRRMVIENFADGWEMNKWFHCCVLSNHPH